MCDKIRILHISKYYSPYNGGTEQIARECVLSVAHNESAADCEQKVICFDHVRGRKDSVDVIDGVEVIRCRQDILIASQALSGTYKARLRGGLQDFDPDIVIFHYPNPFVAHFLLQYIASRARLVIWWHLDIFKQKILKYFFYPQNRRLIDRAWKIVATSPNYIKGSRWLTSARKKCVVIPNCVDEHRLQTTDAERRRAGEIRSVNEGRTICLAVGRHVPYKGYKYLIEVSRKLDDSFRLYIVGVGPLTESLHKLADGDDKVRFLGRIDDSELKAYLLACDIYTFPSITKNEAFGVALAEGMYFGHPAVTFTIPGSGVNYVNLDGVTGIECKNGDSDEYAEAIKRLAKDESLRQSMGEAARKRVLENFVFEKFEENVINMLDLKSVTGSDREE